jgi:transcriptional regulator with GAF, ATPase, and Fis domain
VSAAALRLEDATWPPPRPGARPNGDHDGWEALVEALAVEAGDAGDAQLAGNAQHAIDAAIRRGEERGNRSVVAAALALAAALGARHGAAGVARGARERLAVLVRAWADTLAAAERGAALARPDRAALLGAPSAAGPAARERARARLVEVAIALAQERDVARLCDLALDAAMAATDAERGMLLLLDGGSAAYRVAATRHLDRAASLEALLGPSSTIARQALEKGEVVVSEDVRADARFADCASIGAEVTGVLCAPIHARAELEGAIYLDRRRNGRSFDGEAITAARALGGVLATALLNARVIADLEVRTRELETARAELAVALERRTVERDDMSRRLASIEDVVPGGADAIVGRAPAMLRLRGTIASVARSDAPVLVAGETGSGKELVARAIHASSARRDGPIVAVNCGALSETLLAAELFGVERGAYTSANASRPGLFVAAHGGTLFLDEVGDMPPAMQTALLRVLETSEIRPVGSTRARKVDVRIVAASHRDLVELVRRGTFRDDLRYRLEVVRVEVPPLRERLEDLPELCGHLLLDAGRRYGLPERRLSAEALQALALRRWPGNVRELRHVLTGAALAASGPLIAPRDLPPERAADRLVAAGGPAADAAAAPPVPDVDGHALRVESIRRALKATAGHRGRAAGLLGISRSTLYRYLDAYSIDVGEFDLPPADRED